MDFKLNDIVQFPDRLQRKTGYWQYLTPEFEIYLTKYLRIFENHRRETGLVPSDSEHWNQLPFGPSATNSDWKWRRQSLSIVEQFTKNGAFDCTLEIGAWNGWLTKYLAMKSNTLIAVDYFSLQYDGLSNLNTLAQNIIPLQCNLETLQTDLKIATFDLIVLNHNLSYFENPVGYIEKMKPFLKPGGRIISVGNTFFRNPAKKIKANASVAQQYCSQHGMELYIQPVKGYMDFDDMDQLKALGFQIEPYPAKFLQNLYSRFNESVPFYTYIFYQQRA